MRNFGAHVSVAGGLANGISAATQLNINTIQIHPTAPQRWITKPIDTAGIETMVKAQKDSPVKKLFLHAIYLINLAQPDSQKFHLGKMALVTYLNFLHDTKTIAKHYQSDLETGGTVVHVGSAIHYPTKADALERVSYGINWILENSPGDELLLLESSAGSGQVIGEKLEDLLWLIDKTEQKNRVGITLDTEHMFASGYDWTKPKDVIAEIQKLVPFELIKLIHLNDSKVPCGSKKDRHENLGEGLIGSSPLKELVQHNAFLDIPFVLETPNMKDVESAKIDIEQLRSWVETTKK